MLTIGKTPRAIAVEILNSIEEDGAYAEPLLDTFLSDFPSNLLHDRRLLTNLVYGTMRMRGRLDWIIGQLYRGNLMDMETGVKNILRAGLYQIMFTDRIPGFAIVNEAVKIAKRVHPAASGLVNAILRNAIRKRKEIVYPTREQNPSLYISVVHSHPLWLVNRWMEIFGVDQTMEICAANNEIPPLTLRVNRWKTTRDKVIAQMRHDGFDVRPTKFSPDGVILSNPAIPLMEIPCCQIGWVSVQDEASQLIAHLVAPEAGEAILDVCAGVGRKTTHLAEIIGNQGRIVAFDISGHKVEALRDAAKKSGITILDTMIGDAARDMGNTLRGKFDRVLVDAPCSGLGTLRRNPEIKWRISPEDIKDLASLQKILLKNAAACVKDGGHLIYSTCTLMPEENEDIVEDFLRHNECFRRMQPPGVVSGQMLDDKGFFRTDPHHHGTDGFFAAVLAKKRGTEQPTGKES
ncbi:MAG: 16S rRNA (cytosine(967)-C(5))-methyltransferase RsmB [Syntrophales bacterium]|nr:16S rRNA (cytosine(967)-C(5))-methyltransferase RsmB [Syntrophales bacterium]